MARVVLAISISTVPSESAFSTGGRTISEYRSNLNPEVGVVCLKIVVVIGLFVMIYSIICFVFVL